LADVEARKTTATDHLDRLLEIYNSAGTRP